MRRLPFLLVCPFITGCLAFGYPSNQQTPTIAVPESDVTAFCVTRDLEFHGACIAGAIKLGDSIQQIPITESRVPQQRDSYFCMFPIWRDCRERSIEIALYRPGYELATVPARCSMIERWRTQPITINWKKADSIEGREKAIDDLTQLRAFTRDAAVSRFLANEFSQLANDSTLDDAKRAALAKKSEEILSRSK